MKSNKIDITVLFDAHVAQRKQEEAAERAAQQAAKDKRDRQVQEVTLAIREVADAAIKALQPHLGKSLRYDLSELEDSPYDYDMEREHYGFRGEIYFHDTPPGTEVRPVYQTRIRAIYHKTADRLESVSFRGHANEFISGTPEEKALKLAIEVYESFEPDEE